MKFIADFHIHSHFSMATSKQLTPEYLDYWAKIKGLNVVATGDFTHPGWLKELKQKLEPAEPGLFKLKKEFILPNNYAQNIDVRFILTAEISNIYKKYDKVRKIHNVVLAPDFETVEKIQFELSKRNFNITSDGRPILGLDARDLLEIILTANENNFFIPAHIWTPWFSALGSKSGFDTIDECYADLGKYIYAIETGLSTNAPLNWMCSFLDKYTLLSNSDAHSPEKLGRNANILNTTLSYPAIIEAIKDQKSNKFMGTIDMFPQEGKYHYDGHRKCGVCWNPVETLKHNGICSKCGKPVVIGVTNRIVELSDRTDIMKRPNRKPFYSIIPLKEILSEITGVGPNTKTVDRNYVKIIQKAGSEFNVLLNLSISDVKKAAGELIGEAIKRMREGRIIIKEGFDGEFGVIKVFNDNEIKNYGAKKSIFEISAPAKNTIPKLSKDKLLNFDLSEYQELRKTYKIVKKTTGKKKLSEKNNNLNKQYSLL